MQVCSCSEIVRRGPLPGPLLTWQRWLSSEKRSWTNTNLLQSSSLLTMHSESYSSGISLLSSYPPSSPFPFLFSSLPFPPPPLPPQISSSPLPLLLPFLIKSLHLLPLPLLLKSLHLPPPLSPPHNRWCISELSPVCAVVGGVLAQEIIKAISAKDRPYSNSFLYNARQNTGIIELLHP